MENKKSSVPTKEEGQKGTEESNEEGGRLDKH